MIVRTMRFLAAFAIVMASITVVRAASVAGSEIPPRPGWLGLGFRYHPPSGADAGWLAVYQLEPKGPAEVGGLRVQDTVAAIDGHALRYANERLFFEWLATIRPGQHLTFDVRRGAKRVRLRVTAAPMSDTNYARWKAKFDRG